jgi:hypothetical protein
LLHRGRELRFLDSVLDSIPYNPPHLPSELVRDCKPCQEQEVG